MAKRPRQSDNRYASAKRRKVDRALEVQCPFRVYAREHDCNYPEDHCEEGKTFKGNERLKFVTCFLQFSDFTKNNNLGDKLKYFKRG